MLTEKTEAAYIAGQRSAWINILGEAMRYLGYDAPEATALVLEREEALQLVRMECSEYADVPSDMHLRDAIAILVKRHESVVSSLFDELEEARESKEK